MPVANLEPLKVERRFRGGASAPDLDRLAELLAPLVRRDLGMRPVVDHPGRTRITGHAPGAVPTDAAPETPDYAGAVEDRADEESET